MVVVVAMAVIAVIAGGGGRSKRRERSGNPWFGRDEFTESSVIEEVGVSIKRRVVGEEVARDGSDDLGVRLGSMMMSLRAMIGIMRASIHRAACCVE